MEALVTVEHPNGTAGVVLQHGQPWLTDDVGRGGSTGLEGTQPGRQGLGEGSLYGGMLPPGASRARVHDALGDPHDPAVGGGAWALVLPGSPGEVAVAFLDQTGSLVRPELPSSYRREPITDSDEPCPACGGSVWELITPDDPRHGSSSSGDGPEIPSQFACCVACGHEEGTGGWFGFGGDEDDEESEQPTAEELARWRAEWEEEQREEQAQVLESIAFPLRAPEGETVTLGGWGGSSDEAPSNVTLRGERVSVTSTLRGEFGWSSSEAEEAGRELGGVISEVTAWPESSEAARTLWLRARDREQARAVAKAWHGTRKLRVDGVPVSFTVADAGQDRWSAVGRVGQVRLTVTSQGVAMDAIHLRTLANATQLDGGFVAPRTPPKPVDPSLDDEPAGVQGMALSRQDIQIFAEDAGVPEDVAELIAEHARPAIALVADGPVRDPLGTKGGGRPALTSGTTWPASPGYPHVFLLQLRLDELPDLGELPRHGLLSVFIPWDPGCGELDGPAHIALVDEAEERAPVDPPTDLADQDDGRMQDGVLTELALRPEVVWTVPTPQALLRLEPDWPSQEDGWLGDVAVGYDADAYWALEEALQERQEVSPEARLLGWPSVGSQGGDAEVDVMTRARATETEAWRLLLELPSARLVPSFGDGGEGFVCVPAADLAAGSFDRAHTGCETG